MARTISTKTVKVSKSKPNGKSTPIKKLVLIQISAYMKYNTVIRLKKEKKNKYLSFMTEP